MSNHEFNPNDSTSGIDDYLDPEERARIDKISSRASSDKVGLSPELRHRLVELERAKPISGHTQAWHNARKLILAEAEVRRLLDRPARLSEYRLAFPELSNVLETEGDESVSDCRKLSETRPKLEGFRVLDELGRGGMAVVHRALDLKRRRYVAIKTLLLPSNRSSARLKFEAETAAKLKHPGIVEIYELIESDERLFCVMELVEGGSLATKIAHGPVRPRSAALLVKSISEAVEHAHKNQILHRDLKTLNVLLTKDGRPKVADFGLAYRLDDDSDARLTNPNELVGTLSSMAPEQTFASSHRMGILTPATDVFGLGSILYECLTGRTPFDGGSFVELIQRIRVCDPTPISILQPDVPRDLETICMRALHRNPRHRYASAESLCCDLARFLDGRPIVAKPPSRLNKMATWYRRQPALANALLIGLVGLTAVLAVWGMMTVRIIHERDIAREQRAFAQQQKEIAEFQTKSLERAKDNTLKQIGETRKAISTFLLNVAANPHLQKYGLEDVRSQLLSQARDLYEEWAETGQLEDWSLHEFADLCLELAKVQEERNQLSEAEETLLKAIDIAKMIEDPKESRFQRTFRAMINNQLGHIRFLRNEHDQAISLFAEAVSLWETVLAEEVKALAANPNPNETDRKALTYTKSQMISSIMNQAISLNALHGIPAASPLYSRITDLSAESLENESIASASATAIYRLSQTPYMAHDWAKTEELLSLGMKIVERWNRSTFNRTETEIVLISIRTRLAYVSAKLKKEKYAEQLIEDALKHMRLIRELHPGITHYLVYLSRTEAEAAEIAELFHKYDDAIEHGLRAFKLADDLLSDPKTAPYERSLMGRFLNDSSIELTKRLRQSDRHEDLLHVGTRAVQLAQRFNDPTAKLSRELRNTGLVAQADAYERTGRHALALESWTEAAKNTPDDDRSRLRSRIGYARSLATSGKLEESKTEAAAIEKEFVGSYDLELGLATVYAQLVRHGDLKAKNRAIELIQRGSKGLDKETIQGILVLIYFDPIRDQPEFQSLLQTIGD